MEGDRRMNPQEFIRIIAPIAVKLRREGSPVFPSLRIAQAAHETGWTIHPWNNLVGFKVGSRKPNGYWKGAYVNKGTWEVYDGKRTDVVAAFRAYDTIEDCFRDQDELFKIPRYEQVRKSTTPEDQAVALYRCGYATDPQYHMKLINIIQQYDLKKFDEEADEVSLDPGVAKTIIKTWISPAWFAADQQMKEAKDSDSAAAWKKQRDYYHWLANQLRKAAGLPQE